MTDHKTGIFSRFSWLLLACLFFSFASPLPSFANDLGEEEIVFNQTIENPVKAELFSEDKSIQPDKPFWLAIKLSMEDGWHAYWKNPGPIGMPISFNWDLPAGVEVAKILWPAPEQLETPLGTGYGYSGQVQLLVKVQPNSLKQGDRLPIHLKLKWLACSDSNCLPGEQELDLSLSVSGQAIADQAQESEFKKARSKIPAAEFTQENAAVDNHHLKITLAGIPQSLKTASLYFAPSSQDVVDEEKLSWEELKPGTIALEIPLSEKVHPENVVEGVLVAKNGSDQKVLFAADISLPLAPFMSNMTVAMADVSQPQPDRKPTQAEELLAQVKHGNVAKNNFEGGLALAIVLAFIGGMILNLMPCVLPVISFKIMSFVKMSGEKRSVTLKHGMLFSLGVLVSFWVLAIALILLQTYGHAVGWGFQLQEPLFVAILATVIFLFGLSLFGIFEVGTLFASWAGQKQAATPAQSSSNWGSFFSGVLATTVATPCTGPFLGSAMGFAMTLPPYLTLLVFTSLGMGMAFPYLIFSAFPKLLRFLPKPGNWMVTFKELMGFIMLATTLWLVWVFGAQTSMGGVVILLGAYIVMGLACWAYGKWATPDKERRSRLMASLMSLGLLLAASYAIFFAATAENYNEPELHDIPSHVAEKPQNIRAWEPFSAERIVALQEQGIPVLIDFTARWCLICQTNHMVLSLKEVSDKLAELGVVKMEADWTTNDPEITKALQLFGRNGVPLYVLYGKDPSVEPYVLPQVLTPEVVLEYLNKLEPAKT